MNSNICFGLLILFLQLVSGSIYAEKSEHKRDTEHWQSDWHEAFYVTGGYLFAHTFYTNNVVAVSEDPLIRGTFPNNYNGFALGFGKGFHIKAPFSYEFDYAQLFNRYSKADGLRIAQQGKAVAGVVSYTLFPESKLRVLLSAGALVSSFITTTTTISPYSYASVTTNSVNVDPLLMAILLYQINPQFAVKAEAAFDFTVGSKVAHVSLIPLLRLNYYPK